MNRTVLILLVAGLTLTGSPDQTEAQSLFDRCDQNSISPVLNNVARNRGDLLVVLINESSDVENIDERSLDRTGTATLNGAVNYGLTGDLGVGNGTGSIGQTSDQSRSFTGDSEFRSARQFQDQFTVTVIDVLPNGNMLVKGKRKVTLQGDSRTLQLTGIIRKIDVLPNNVISSQLVANLEIKLLAEGTEDEISKQGWLGKRLNKILPF